MPSVKYIVSFNFINVDHSNQMAIGKDNMCIFFLLHPNSLFRWTGKKMRFRPGKPVKLREFWVLDIVATLRERERVTQQGK